jgi:leucyl aminopeptidase
MINIDFLNDIESSGESTCEVHLIYKTGDEVSLSHSASILDEGTDGLLSETLQNNRFKGKFLDSFFITSNNLPCHDALFVCVGDPAKLTDTKLEKVGGAVYSKLTERGTQGRVLLFVDNEIKSSPTNIAFGIRLKDYKFDRYFTKKDKEETLFNVDICQEDADLTIIEQEYKNKNAMVEGIEFAKNLISEPSNILYPESYANRVKMLEVLGLTVKIYGEKELEKMGAGALLAVGQGSARESKMVVLEWMNGKKKDAPMAFVGKGVCFDTGGYSIKPSRGLKDMKYDMGGSAVVVGTMISIARRNLPINAVGVIGLVENMVSSTAYKPGDVITSMSGQTIEIDNTDAEGRVVLADCLWYTQKTYKPKTMINLATLTGAVSIALGDQLAGIFSNDDAMSKQLIEAGHEVDEKVWRLPCDPIGERYDTYVDSTIADMHNVGKGGEASSTTAAQFLQRFVNDTPWTHIDIAGVTWNDKGSMTAKGGATGWGVKLLNKWIDNNG